MSMLQKREKAVMFQIRVKRYNNYILLSNPRRSPALEEEEVLWVSWQSWNMGRSLYKSVVVEKHGSFCVGSGGR